MEIGKKVPKQAGELSCGGKKEKDLGLGRKSQR